jgi:hypothetical protein
MFECHEALRQVRQRSEIVRCKNLPLDNREINFNLVEPAGMNGPVNKREITILVQESLGGLWTAMRRTVVDDPEDPASLAIGTALHDLIHQAIKRCDATVGFATTKNFSAVDIEGRQIGPGPKPLVFVFDSHGPAGLWGQGLMFSEARLDAGFFVRTENELMGPEFTALPMVLVEIQKSAGFLFEVWVARKDPAAVLPRTDGVLVKPAPYCGVAEGCGQTSVPHMRSEFGYPPTRKGRASDRGKLTGNGFNVHDQFWGEKPGGVPGVGSLPDPPSASQRIAFATC